MKCISLWQPWATLMAIGAKRIETRGWWTSYRGPLLIHAAKKWTPELAAMCQGEPFASTLRDTSLMPFGSIVAIVDLVGVFKTSEVFAKVDGVPRHERAFGDYSAGRFGWVTERPHRLLQPIAYRGQQGLFDVPDELVSGVMAARKAVLA